jgi:hypothetical protein
MKTISLLLVASQLFLTLSCASSSNPEAAKPMRSPSLDYQDPARGPDGEVLGANNQAPKDSLAVGVTNKHGPYKAGAHSDGADAGVPHKH